MFVCREIVEHRNHTFHENGTLSYIPYRKVIALPERSVGDYKTDIVITPNIPLIGLSTMLTEFSSIAAIGLAALTKSNYIEISFLENSYEIRNRMPMNYYFREQLFPFRILKINSLFFSYVIYRKPLISSIKFHFYRS